MLEIIKNLSFRLKNAIQHLQQLQLLYILENTHTEKEKKIFNVLSFYKRFIRVL